MSQDGASYQASLIATVYYYYQQDVTKHWVYVVVFSYFTRIYLIITPELCLSYCTNRFSSLNAVSVHSIYPHGWGFIILSTTKTVVYFEKGYGLGYIFTEAFNMRQTIKQGYNTIQLNHKL